MRSEAALKRLHAEKALLFTGELQVLEAPAAFDEWLDTACAKSWVVYSKLPFEAPEPVLKYLAAEVPNGTAQYRLGPSLQQREPAFSCPVQCVEAASELAYNSHHDFHALMRLSWYLYRTRLRMRGFTRLF